MLNFWSKLPANALCSVASLAVCGEERRAVERPCTATAAARARGSSTGAAGSGRARTTGAACACAASAALRCRTPVRCPAVRSTSARCSRVYAARTSTRCATATRQPCDASARTQRRVAFRRARAGKAMKERNDREQSQRRFHGAPSATRPERSCSEVSDHGALRCHAKCSCVLPDSDPARALMT